MVRILKKSINENQKNWDSQLKFALWANRITTKRSTGKSPYELVYGRAAVFPIQLSLPVAWFLQESEEEPNDLIRRMNQLVELNESREQVNLKLAEYQEKMKVLFDQRATDGEIQVGDLVLGWDVRRENKGKHGKFDALWFGPFRVAEIKGNNTFALEKLEKDILEAPVNGKFLELYFHHCQGLIQLTVYIIPLSILHFVSISSSI